MYLFMRVSLIIGAQLFIFINDEINWYEYYLNITLLALNIWIVKIWF